jgi:hypothetical protein
VSGLDGDVACAFALSIARLLFVLEGKSPHLPASKQKYVAKLAMLYYLCSHAAVLKRTLSVRFRRSHPDD